MLTDGYEPRFDRDYQYGRQGELVLDDLLDRVAHGDARLEIKHKSLPDVDLYVELEQNPHRCGVWKPSGLSTTEAEVWAYVIGDTGVTVLIPTDRLRRAVTLGLGNPKDGGAFGDNPTRGRLINLGAILSARCDP